jgi:hypothetical protein
VREAAQRLHEQHDRWNAGSRNLCRVVKRPAREAVRRLARHLADRFGCELDQRIVEEDRLDLPDPLPLDLEVLFACELL